MNEEFAQENPQSDVKEMVLNAVSEGIEGVEDPAQIAVVLRELADMLEGE